MDVIIVFVNFFKQAYHRKFQSSVKRTKIGMAEPF